MRRKDERKELLALPGLLCGGDLPRRLLSLFPSSLYLPSSALFFFFLSSFLLALSRCSPSSCCFLLLVARSAFFLCSKVGPSYRSRASAGRGDGQVFAEPPLRHLRASVELLGKGAPTQEVGADSRSGGRRLILCRRLTQGPFCNFDIDPETVPLMACSLGWPLGWFSGPRMYFEALFRGF